MKFNAKGDFEDSGRVEYAYSKMAVDAGLEMPETQLLDDQYFAVHNRDDHSNHATRITTS